MKEKPNQEVLRDPKHFFPQRHILPSLIVIKDRIWPQTAVSSPVTTKTEERLCLLYCIFQHNEQKSSSWVFCNRRSLFRRGWQRQNSRFFSCFAFPSLAARGEWSFIRAPESWDIGEKMCQGGQPGLELVFSVRCFPCASLGSEPMLGSDLGSWEKLQKHWKRSFVSNAS